MPFPRSRTWLHCSTLDLWPSDLYLCIHILRLSWSNLEVEFEISCQLYWSKLEREWEITNKGFLDYGYLLQEFFSVKAAMHLSRAYSSHSTITFQKTAAERKHVHLHILFGYIGNFGILKILFLLYLGRITFTFPCSRFVGGKYVGHPFARRFLVSLMLSKLDGHFSRTPFL